jgi:hypothetical protein
MSPVVTSFSPSINGRDPRRDTSAPKSMAGRVARFCFQFPSGPISLVLAKGPGIDESKIKWPTRLKATAKATRQCVIAAGRIRGARPLENAGVDPPMRGRATPNGPSAAASLRKALRAQDGAMRRSARPWLEVSSERTANHAARTKEMVRAFDFFELINGQGPRPPVAAKGRFAAVCNQVCRPHARERPLGTPLTGLCQVRSPHLVPTPTRETERADRTRREKRTKGRGLGRAMLHNRNFWEASRLKCRANSLISLVPVAGVEPATY